MKHFLELTDVNGREVFIAAEDISALVATNNMCSIFSTGIPTAIIVRKSHFEVIKAMEEIGAFKLVKFS